MIKKQILYGLAKNLTKKVKSTIIIIQLNKNFRAG